MSDRDRLSELEQALARNARRADRERRARSEAEAIAERATRELYEQQQGLRLLGTVAKAANEATIPDDATVTVLESVCAHSGWAVGHAWWPTEDGGFESRGHWAGDLTRFAAFIEATSQRPLAPGHGLPGRVLAAGGAVWVRDFSTAFSLPRASAAAAVELRTAIGFPVLIESEVVGVLEFFTERLVERDPALVALMAGVGTELGRVVERHRAATELARAHARAVAASQMKSQFMANMNHELRTPLNGVIGISDLLLDTELSVVQREYAEALRFSGESLLAVIGDILDFSKLEAGRLELVDGCFELRPLVEEVCSMVAAGAAASAVRIYAELDDALPNHLRGDEKRVRQVLTNLVSNAVKFTAEGEVLVSASPITGPAEDPMVGLSVTDTGIGIEPAAQEAIFESFTQADGSTTRRYGGTGLGLTISRQLVEMMGGAIGVQSTPGEGSTFSFTIPLRPGAGHPAMAPEVLRGTRVLLVAEAATSRRVLSAHLRWAGAALEVAESVESALGLLRSTSELPHALVVEAEDVTSLVQELARGPVPPPPLILIASARAATPTPEVAAVITRPVRRSRLLEALAIAVDETTRAVVHAPAAPPSAVGPTVPARRVLVAEDNAINQLVARRLLEQRGYVVDLAGTGRQAVDMHLAAPYAAIFMDCQMPELDGYAATGEIRQREPATRHTPIIALTASTLPEEIERCLTAGMDSHLGKPIAAAELDRALAHLLDLISDTTPADGANQAPAPASQLGSRVPRADPVS